MRGIIPLILLILVELYSYQLVKTLSRNKWVLVFYILISVLFVIYLFFFAFYSFDRSVGQTKFTLFTIGLFLLIYIPKLVITLVLLTEDVLEFLKAQLLIL